MSKQPQGAHFFIIRSLQGIIANCPNKNTELKSECKLLLDSIEKLENEQIINDVRNNPNKYLKSFSIACQTKISKLQEISIDCLHVKFILKNRN